MEKAEKDCERLKVWCSFFGVVQKLEGFQENNL